MRYTLPVALAAIPARPRWEDPQESVSVTPSPPLDTVVSVCFPPAGGPVHICRLRDYRQEQHPGCPESLRVLGLVQHPPLPTQHPPDGHQQHCAGTAGSAGASERVRSQGERTLPPSACPHFPPPHGACGPGQALLHEELGKSVE